MLGKATDAAFAEGPGERPAGQAKNERLRLVLIAVSLGLICVQLDFFALTLALPEMARDLGVTTTDLQWVLSGYMLALGALLVLGGRLGDIFGRKYALLAGLGLFGGAALVCGFAPSAGFIVGFRILQGVGAALIFPTSVAVLSNAFPAARRGPAIGRAFGLAAVGTAVGPFAGGLLTEGPGWRWVFWVLVPIAAAAAVLVALATENSRDPHMARHLDVVGALALSLGVASLTFAVDRGQTWGWVSAGVLGACGAGVVLLVIFATVERRVGLPLVDLRLLRNIPYVLITMSGTLSNIAFGVTVFTATLFLQAVRGLSPLLAGLVFLAPSVTSGLAGPLSGWLGERYRPYPILASGNTIGGLSLFGLTIAQGWVLYVCLFGLCGLGFGLGWSYASVGTQAVVRPERAGEAAGVAMTSMITIAGMAVAVSATVVEILRIAGVPYGAAIDDVLRVIAAGLLLVGIVLWVGPLLGRHPHADPHPHAEHRHRALRLHH